jgi:hypothetical protein
MVFTARTSAGCLALVVALAAVGVADGHEAPALTGRPAAEIVISDAAILGGWRESVFRGSLRVAGTATETSNLHLRLLPRSSSGRTFNADVTVPTGTFARTLPLPARFVPGRYLLTLTGTGVSGATIPEQERELVIEAPAEGVVSSAWISRSFNGPPVDRVANTVEPRGKKHTLFLAHFVFAAQPRAGTKLTVTWFTPRRPSIGTARKANTRVVVSYLAYFRDPRNTYLKTGRWGAILRSDGRVAKRVSVLVYAPR